MQTGLIIFKGFKFLCGVVVGGGSYWILSKVAGGYIPPGPIMAGVAYGIAAVVFPMVETIYIFSPFTQFMGFGAGSVNPIPFTS